MNDNYIILYIFKIFIQIFILLEANLVFIKIRAMFINETFCLNLLDSFVTKANSLYFIVLYTWSALSSIILLPTHHHLLSQLNKQRFTIFFFLKKKKGMKRLRNFPKMSHQINVGVRTRSLSP